MNSLLAPVESLIKDGQPGLALQLLQEHWYRFVNFCRPHVLPVGWSNADALAGAAARDLVSPADHIAAKGHGPVLIIATEIYAWGGHTPVIGDLVNAVGGNCRLLITRTNPEADAQALDAAIARTGLTRDEVEFAPVEGYTNPVPLVKWLRKRISENKPSRLILAHHPDDVSVPAVASVFHRLPVCLLNHGDVLPCTGYFLPGVVLMQLSPRSAHWSDKLGVRNHLIPLCSSANYGLTKARRWMNGGFLKTATVSRPEKFSGSFPVTFVELLLARFDANSGSHLQVGGIPNELLCELYAAMDARSIDRERLELLDWSDDLAGDLHQREIDLVIGSIPIGGARTCVELNGAGIPQIRAAIDPVVRAANNQFMPDGALGWTGINDFRQVLRSLDPKQLARLSKAAVTKHKSAQTKSHFDSAVVVALRMADSPSVSGPVFSGDAFDGSPLRTLSDWIAELAVDRDAIGSLQRSNDELQARVGRLEELVEEMTAAVVSDQLQAGER